MFFTHKQHPIYKISVHFTDLFSAAIKQTTEFENIVLNHFYDKPIHKFSPNKDCYSLFRLNLIMTMTKIINE